MRRKLAALFLGAVWLTSSFAVPLGPFDGVPFYICIAAVVLLLNPGEATVRAASLLALLFGYELLKVIQPEFVWTTKSLMGLAAFVCVATAAHMSMQFLSSESSSSLAQWLRFVLLLIASSVAVDQALAVASLRESPYPHYFLPIDRHSGVFFNEPSHLALAVAPYILMAAYNFKMFKRYLGMRSVLALATTILLCPSATLFGVCILAGAVVLIARLLTGRALGVIGSAAFVGGLTYAALAAPEIAERFVGAISISPDAPLAEQNFSVLIFTKGREMAEYALQHFPLGVGFLNMEVLAPHSTVTWLVDILADLNSKDGSALLFKGICEFGAPFLALSVLALLRFLRTVTRPQQPSLFSLLVVGVQFATFSHLFRSASYFDGVIAIGLSMLISDLVPYSALRATTRTHVRRRAVFTALPSTQLETRMSSTSQASTGQRGVPFANGLPGSPDGDYLAHPPSAADPWQRIANRPR